VRSNFVQLAAPLIGTAEWHWYVAGPQGKRCWKIVLDICFPPCSDTERYTLKLEFPKANNAHHGCYGSFGEARHVAELRWYGFYSTNERKVPIVDLEKL
jgi:hypothetical protein